MSVRRTVLAALAASSAVAVVLAQAQNLTPDQIRFQRNPATG